ncbi:ATP-binding cassette domain-containing protein [Thomasclavelia ramosa]|uniref:ATP-binding cassette domain-containing protein n=1 Tax=Thomasclavelia ramosa TaxID=1547 RepID=UPI003DA671FF
MKKIIETDGQPLSSGQAQIVMLIRAIIKKPEVLILDEALCNIDDYKAKKIISYIHDNLPNTIMIIVAHQTKLVNELFDCAIIRDGKIYK